MGIRIAVLNALAAVAIAGVTARVADRGPTAANVAAPLTRALADQPSEPLEQAAPVPAGDTAFVQSGLDLLGAHLGRVVSASAKACVRACTFIVVVPDPIDSRLDWQFDAGLEATRRGFEANGFVLERFWLPWTLDADSSLRKRDRTHAPLDLRRRHPGVMLFRHVRVLRSMSGQAQPDTLVAVAYLVGETPTSGIHQAAFDAAIADRDELRAATSTCPDPAAQTRDELRVVGPTFSGSIQSLRRRIGSWVGTPNGSDSTARVRHATVISGGATASTAGADMTRGAELQIDYSATINAFDTLLNRLCASVLDSAFAMHQGEVAVIAESNTGFGQAVGSGFVRVDSTLRADSTNRADSVRRADSARDANAAQPALVTAARPTRAGNASPRTPGGAATAGLRATGTVCQRMLRVPFPMSISRLRAEYARHPANTGPAAPLALGTSGSRLPVDLQDPASSLESPPAMSDLTPAALERVMDDIGQTLLAHRIRAVVVIATDVRDRIFVANEVKRRLRDMRIIFIGSHTLYTRPEFNEQLRGALVVSTYPLFLENQYWTRLTSASVERIVFSNELAEGAYNATLMQLAPITGYLQARDSIARAIDSALAPVPAADSAARMQSVWRRAIATSDSQPLDSLRCSALRRGALTDYRTPHRHEAADTLKALEGPHPPVWVTIVGRTTITPVRSFPTASERDTAQPASSRYIARGCALADPDSLSFEAPPTRAGPWEGGLPAGAAFLVLLTLVYTFAPSLLGIHASPSEFPSARKSGEKLTDALRLERSAELQAHTAGFVLPIIALCAVVPLLLVPLRALTHMWGIEWWMAAFLAIAVVLAFAAAVSAAFGEGKNLLLIASSARGDAGFQCLVVVTSVLFYLGSVATLTIEAVRLPHPKAAEFYTRALELSSGVTPVAPLTIGGLFLITWAYGHRQRARAMRRGFAAESWWPVGATTIRKRLLALASGPSSYALLVILTTIALWIATEVQQSPERIVGSRFDGFDHAYRGMIIAVLAITTWTTVRLAETALALRRLLNDVDGLCYADAFGRLPVRLGALARVSPLAAPAPMRANDMITSELSVREHVLSRISPRAWRQLFGLLEPGAVAASHWDHERKQRSRVNAAAQRLFSALDRGARWRAGLSQRAQTTLPPVAEEILALMALDYIAWIIRHIRLLAIGLLAAIALGAWFLACYSFEPHTFIRICFFGVAGVGILVILTVLVQMNRDPVLSRLTHTTLGETTWDLPFLANIATVLGIPLVTILGSQFPEVRDFLFGWLAPLLRTIGRG